MSTNDIEYYKTYYERMGSNAYLGENMKSTSRMLVFQEWLRSYLKPGAKVLDIGCGDAIFAELMPEFEWYGVDINTERASARIKDIVSGNVTEKALYEHDLMKTPYPFIGNTFDAVICSEVLEHLWDLRVVHREAKRLLKREGVYVISTPNFQWLANHFERFQRIRSQFDQHWTIEHIRHYDYDLHARYLNECGFTVDKHTGADAHFCPILGPITVAIADKLKAKGVDQDVCEIQKWAGAAFPMIQHTTVIASRKA